MALPSSIAIAGASWPASLPSLGVREELAVRYSQAQETGGHAALRVLAAAVGLCSAAGGASRASLSRMDYRILDYGEAVYSWLRERGASPQEVAEAGSVCLTAIVESLAPRASEVEAAAGFSAPGAAG